MKFIRTQRGHERVTLPKHGEKVADGETATVVVIDRNPLEVSNEAADAYAKAAAAVGVGSVVLDADGAPESDNPDGGDDGQTVDPPAVVTGSKPGETATDTTKTGAAGTTKEK